MIESMRQKQAFIEGEGDAYWRRNSGGEHRVNDDPVLRVLERLGIRRRAVIEIGCGSCDRLASLHAATGAACFGIDPSKAAIDFASAHHPQLTLKVGTADVLPFPSAAFDLVIFGFCLYVVDPDDLFVIAAEADRVLENQGTLLIHDFCTPRPYSNDYAHRDGIRSHKMDRSTMFTWNPAYSLVHREWASSGSVGLGDVDARATVDVLFKDVGRAFPPMRYASAGL